jgi:hypothetical protein
LRTGLFIYSKHKRNTRRTQYTSKCPITSFTWILFNSFQSHLAVYLRYQITTRRN